MDRHWNCEEVREQLLNLANPAAELPAAAGEHLRACSACQAELEKLRQTWSLLDEWRAPEPSPYFDSRLQARMREEQARVRDNEVAPQATGILAWLGVRWQPALAGILTLVLVVAVAIFRIAGTQQNVAIGPEPTPQASPAVYDLQNLDKNADVYNNFDMLYDDDQQPSDQ